MLNSDLSDSLNLPFIRVFLAVMIQLPSKTLQLLDGSGTVVFPVNGVATTFQQRDETYGFLGSMGNISEAIATAAPTVTLTILPETSESIAAMASPFAQGSPVYIWFGTVNDVTGDVIGSPELLFSGQLDTLNIKEGVASLTVEVNVVSVFEKMFHGNEGLRLNLVHQQSVYPHEDGLKFTSTGTDTFYWGTDTASSSAFTYVKRTSTAVR